MSFIGLAIGGGALLGLVGSGISASAAKSAANTQANASQNATNAQLSMFNTIQGNEQPWVQSGQGAQSELSYLLGTGGSNFAGAKAGTYGSLLSPFTAQMMQQYSPAYQFQRAQGQYGTLNASASGQGALSGAAQQGLESYNQNMANTAFNNAFNQYQTQQGNIYSRLAGISQLGQGAGTNQATGASNFGNSIGQSLTNIGSAQAGGTVGAANAITGGLSNAGNLGLTYALLGGGGNPAAGLGSSITSGLNNYWGIQPGTAGDIPALPSI